MNLFFRLICSSTQSIQQRNIEDEIAQCDKKIQTILNGIILFQVILFWLFIYPPSILSAWFFVLNFSILHVYTQMYKVYEKVQSQQDLKLDKLLVW